LQAVARVMVSLPGLTNKTNKVAILFMDLDLPSGSYVHRGCCFFVPTKSSLPFRQYIPSPVLITPVN